VPQQQHLHVLPSAQFVLAAWHLLVLVPPGGLLLTLWCCSACSQQGLLHLHERREPSQVHPLLFDAETF
jgi:hypothetical protein